MKVVILAGGKGSRLAEETGTKSKAMVRVGDDPILWHIVKYYGSYGFTDFVIALGYQAASIVNYFAGLRARQPTIATEEGRIFFPYAEPDLTVELIRHRSRRNHVRRAHQATGLKHWPAQIHAHVV